MLILLRKGGKMTGIFRKKEERKERGALFIPAGLFLGFGLGFLFNNLIPWMFIGLGVGFLIFAIIALIKDK
jgi:hypothetical protein